MEKINDMIEITPFKKYLVLLLIILLVLLGCSRAEKSRSSYEILSVQDFSHGEVGKFSAKVYLKQGLPEKDIKKIIKDITGKIERENNADVVWLLVYNSKTPTIDNLIATTQWIHKDLKKELRPYVEKSPVSIPLHHSPIYITWKR